MPGSPRKGRANGKWRAKPDGLLVTDLLRLGCQGWHMLASVEWTYPSPYLVLFQSLLVGNVLARIGLCRGTRVAFVQEHDGST